MSLLQEDAIHADDASSHGEDYAKGSGHIILASVAAFVLLSIGFAVFLWVNNKPPLAAGEVTRVWVHPVHTISKPIDAGGVQMAAEQFDQILVFAQVRFRNQSDQAIVLRDMLTNVHLEDGLHSSYAASATDYDRIFIAYPQLAGLRSHTLKADTSIAPGEVVDGMIVSSFHVSKEVWDSRKDMNFQIEFKLHPSLILVPKGDIVEQ